MAEHDVKFVILSVIASSALIMSLIVVPQVNFVRGQSTDPYIFSVDSSPYSTSFKEWTQKWWQWYVSVPKLNNPNFEEAEDVKYVPKPCSYLQDPASPVFFVPYVIREKGAFATMTCDVPRNKAIMVGIDNGIMDFGDPTVQPKTVDMLTKIVTQSNIFPNKFDITLDGKPLALTNEQKYRVQSEPVNTTLPQNNIWDERPGTYLSVADGWYLMLKPLPPGDHILHYTTGYRDHKSDPTIPSGQGNKDPYIQDVTYHLVVK